MRSPERRLRQLEEKNGRSNYIFDEQGQIKLKKLHELASGELEEEELADWERKKLHEFFERYSRDDNP